MGAGLFGNIVTAGKDASKTKTQATPEGTSVTRGEATTNMTTTTDGPKMVSPGDKMLAVVAGAVPTAVKEANKIAKLIIPGFTKISALDEGDTTLLRSALDTRIDLIGYGDKMPAAQVKMRRGLRAVQSILWMHSRYMRKMKDGSGKGTPTGDVRA